ncbi:nucleoside hydrolase [Serratia ureilytica]
MTCLRRPRWPTRPCRTPPSRHRRTDLPASRRDHAGGDGPLTNVAHAMQLTRRWRRREKEIVIMVACSTFEGYIKDTNFGLDPEAARLVLNSGTAITLAPLDVTAQTMLTQADLAALTQPDHPAVPLRAPRRCRGSTIRAIRAPAELLDP